MSSKEGGYKGGCPWGHRRGGGLQNLVVTTPGRYDFMLYSDTNNEVCRNNVPNMLALRTSSSQCSPYPSRVVALFGGAQIALYIERARLQAAWIYWERNESLWLAGIIYRLRLLSSSYWRKPWWYYLTHTRPRKEARGRFFIVLGGV